jgi:hypothetical protein
MKTFSGFVQMMRHPLTHRQGLYLALGLGVALFAAGCGNKESSAPAAGTATSTATTTPETASTPTPERPVLAPPNPEAAAAANKKATIVQQLNRAMIGFRMQNHRNPASVEEVAAFAGIQLPPPPAGKKYALNARGLVVLVDN